MILTNVFPDLFDSNHNYKCSLAHRTTELYCCIYSVKESPYNTSCLAACVQLQLLAYLHLSSLLSPQDLGWRDGLNKKWLYLKEKELDTEKMNRYNWWPFLIMVLIFYSNWSITHVRIPYTPPYFDVYLSGCVCDVMFIGKKNGISSNSSWGCLQSLCTNVLRRNMNPFLLPLEIEQKTRVGWKEI